MRAGYVDVKTNRGGLGLGLRRDECEARFYIENMFISRIGGRKVMVGEGGGVR